MKFLLSFSRGLHQRSFLGFLQKLLQRFLHWFLPSFFCGIRHFLGIPSIIFSRILSDRIPQKYSKGLLSSYFQGFLPDFFKVFYRGLLRISLGDFFYKFLPKFLLTCLLFRIPSSQDFYRDASRDSFRIQFFKDSSISSFMGFSLDSSLILNRFVSGMPPRKL